MKGESGNSLIEIEDKMQIQETQRTFLSSTMQDFEHEVLGIPVIPLNDMWGNIFAVEPSLKRGGHLMITTARIVYCPKDNPGAWVWHFAELEGLSVQASLLKSVITISISGVDLRWQTLKRGANEVASVWSDWRQIGSALAQYPEFEVEIVSIESSQVLKCKKCRCPITIEKVDQDSMRKRCGACYSLHTLNY